MCNDENKHGYLYLLSLTLPPRHNHAVKLASHDRRKFICVFVVCVCVCVCVCQLFRVYLGVLLVLS